VTRIKEAVGKTGPPAPSVFQARTLPPLHSRDGPLAPAPAVVANRTFDAPVLLPPVLSPSITTTPTPKTHASGGRIAEPRALKSRAFSGEDITYYFDT
jgi:hypothetical protein